MRLAPGFGRARAALRRLARETRGNVLMIMGFALIPITFATGMAIDYSSAMRLRTKVDSIADAAVLSGVTMPMMRKGIVSACDVSRRMFTAQVAGLNGLALDTADLAKFKIVITDSYANAGDVTLTCPAITPAIPADPMLPLKRVATITYDGTSRNGFSGVLGRATLPVNGTSTAKTTLAPYIDIHVALDTSQSMGLAASDADALRLWNATRSANGPSHGCTFGCHAFQDADAGMPNATYRAGNDAIAQYVGARLRIDVLRDAMRDMVNTAITNEGNDRLYRFALFRIGQTTSDILSLTDNLPNVLTAVNTITLGPSDATGPGDTNLPHMTGYIYPRITVRGDGTRPSTARAFLFIVTDGVSDVLGSCTFGHCTRPLDPATCQQFKDNNVTVGIVYTTYLPVRSNPFDANDASLRPEYLYLVKSFSAPGYTSPNPSDNSRDIGPALERCASPGWFFEASDGTSIHAAMQRLFNQASQTPTVSH